MLYGEFRIQDTEVLRLIFLFRREQENKIKVICISFW